MAKRKKGGKKKNGKKKRFNFKSQVTHQREDGEPHDDSDYQPMGIRPAWLELRRRGGD